MSEMEQETEIRLDRMAAPEGFADGVMARIAAGRSVPERKAAREWFAWMRPAFAMAVLALASGLGYAVHWQHEREQAAVEQARFAQAMRITSRTLAHVDDEVSRVGEHRLRP